MAKCEDIISKGAEHIAEAGADSVIKTGKKIFGNMSLFTKVCLAGALAISAKAVYEEISGNKIEFSLNGEDAGVNNKKDTIYVGDIDAPSASQVDDEYDIM